MILQVAKLLILLGIALPQLGGESLKLVSGRGELGLELKAAALFPR